MARSSEPRLIIIGCGVGGIALASRLRSQVHYKNFIIYEREEAIGGTWFLNTYPGVGCDVDSHLYSFSFNPNPEWSQRFAEQKEILQYLNDTVDKFGVRPHVRSRIEVINATWNNDRQAWRVGLRDLETGHTFHDEAEMLVSCVGTISIPKECNIPNHESYKGALFHSSRWNHKFELKGKRVGVVGNGCSGAQLMPHVAEVASQVIQFQRSPQWINDRPNPKFSGFFKWCHRNIPLYNKIYRFRLWQSTDALHLLYITGDASADRDRDIAQAESVNYMKKMAPPKYHEILIPKFPLGCKRRVFDPGYLDCLHRANVELTNESIVSFTEKGLKTTKREIPLDAVVLSTGFKIQEFLSPIEVIGKEGETLNQHWKNTRGAQAYRSTFVHGFPNFGIVFGPNAFPAHNSVIYTNETQVEYIIKTLVRPMLKGSFEVLDVKQAAENYDANYIQERLKDMVWSGGCVNWNLDAAGRNTTNYHDPTWKFWYQLFWPVWGDFDLVGGNGSLPMSPWMKFAVWGTTIPVIFGYAAKGFAVASRRGMFS